MREQGLPIETLGITSAEESTECSRRTDTVLLNVQDDSERKVNTYPLSLHLRGLPGRETSKESELVVELVGCISARLELSLCRDVRLYQRNCAEVANRGKITLPT
ncbi:MAG: hypothetical protein H0X43_02250 [Nitrosospira sp.]|nr:hypothetical protein [Nitrosospira sp.]